MSKSSWMPSARKPRIFKSMSQSNYTAFARPNTIASSGCSTSMRRVMVSNFLVFWHDIVLVHQLCHPWQHHMLRFFPAKLNTDTFSIWAWLRKRVLTNPLSGTREIILRKPIYFIRHHVDEGQWRTSKPAFNKSKRRPGALQRWRAPDWWFDCFSMLVHRIWATPLQLGVWRVLLTVNSEFTSWLSLTKAWI